MSTPLYRAVRAYVRLDRSRFHMPGHKGRGASVLSPLLAYDVTEVEGVDSLYHAEGPILEMEQAFARVYGTERSLICAGGATLCIQTMLALACKPGQKVIMSRNIHRAAINAAALLDLEPVWIYPEQDAGVWFSGRYSPQTVSEALQQHPDAAAVYITSPDYFGVISDLSGIAQVCRASDVPLLVDNAHGAHLKFLPGNLHPTDCAVTMCCDSLHKTLPAMTGAAALHICDARYVPQAKRLMSIFGSTSPSYPIMLSCEDVLRYAEGDAVKGFARTTQALERLRKLAVDKGFAVVQGTADPAKLVLGFGALGLDTQTFATHLRTHRIEPEYIGGTAAVLMANGFNRPRDYARAKACLAALLVDDEPTACPPVLELPRLQQVMRVREATFSTQETVLVENCVGRIAAGESSPCPPGIPIIMSGELLDEQAVRCLKTYGVMQINVVSEANMQQLDMESVKNSGTLLDNMIE